MSVRRRQLCRAKCQLVELGPCANLDGWAWENNSVTIMNIINSNTFINNIIIIIAIINNNIILLLNFINHVL